LVDDYRNLIGNLVRKIYENMGIREIYIYIYIWFMLDITGLLDILITQLGFMDVYGRYNELVNIWFMVDIKLT